MKRPPIATTAEVPIGSLIGDGPIQEVGATPSASRWHRIDNLLTEAIGDQDGSMAAVDRIVAILGRMGRVDRTYAIKNLSTRAVRCQHYHSPRRGGTDPLIYVASSWRNEGHPRVVALLRDAGHEVYDFRNPRPGEHGFAWGEIDPDWQSWEFRRFRECLDHPIAVGGFAADMTALRSAAAGVLVLPCGRSAHIEAGWMIGAGKPVAIYSHAGDERHEPELMYRMADRLVVGPDELIAWARRFEA